MSGFASGVQAGLAMSNQWLDTYERAQRRGLMAQAKKKADFGEYDRISADKAAQLHEMDAMRDERGRRVYDFEIAPGSTTYVPKRINYNDSQIDVEGFTPALEYPSSRGLGPEPSPVAQAFGVERPEYSVRQLGGIPSGTEDEGRFPLYAEPGMRLSEGRPEVSSVVGGTPVAPDAAPAREETGLTTSAPEYTPTLDMYRPQDTQAYAGLTRPGEQGAIGPDKTVYMGREYGLGELTEAQKRAAQYEEYAAVHERLGDPESAMRLRQAAAQERRAEAAETRAAELHPIQRDAAKQNLELGKLQLDEAKFGAEDKAKVRKLGDFIAANPGVPTKVVLTEANRLGVSLKAQDEAIRQLTGITTAELEHSKALITSKIKDMSFDDMLAEHKNNDMISPGSHYEAVRDAKGNVALYMVDTATGKRTTEAPDFTGSMQEADQYLRRAAIDKSSLLDFTMNVKKFQTEMEKNQAAAYEARQKGDYYSKGGSGSSSAGATREYVAMVGEARMLSTEIERLTGIVNDKTADPKLRKNAEARLNDALDQYKEVSGAIRGMRGLGGTPAPTDRGRLYKVGIPFPGPDGKTYVLDRDAYQLDITPDMVKEYKAPPAGGGAAAATGGAGAGTKVRGDTGAPAQQGMTDKEYEAWVDNKLMGVFSGPNKYLEISNTHPDPKVRAAAKRLYDKYQKAREE